MLTKKPNLKDKHAVEKKLKQEVDKKKVIESELDKVDESIDRLSENKVKINKK